MDNSAVTKYFEQRCHVQSSIPEQADGYFDPEDLPRLFRRVAILEEGFTQMNDVIQTFSVSAQAKQKDVQSQVNAQLMGQANQASDLQNELQQTFEKLREDFVATVDADSLKKEVETMVGRVATDIQDIYATEVGHLRKEVDHLSTQLRYELARRSMGSDSAAHEVKNEPLRDEIDASLKEMRDESEAKMCAISAALGEELAGIQKMQQDMEHKILARAVEEAKIAVAEQIEQLGPIQEEGQGARGRSRSASPSLSPTRGPFCPPNSLYAPGPLLKSSRPQSPDIPRPTPTKAVRHISQPVLGLGHDSMSSSIKVLLPQNSASSIIQSVGQTQTFRSRSVSREALKRSFSPLPPDGRVRSMSPERSLISPRHSHPHIISPREICQMPHYGQPQMASQVAQPAQASMPVIASSFVSSLPPYRAPERRDLPSPREHASSGYLPASNSWAPAAQQRTVSGQPTPVLPNRSSSPIPSTPVTSTVSRMSSSQESRSKVSTPRGSREASYRTSVSSKRNHPPVLSEELSARIAHVLAMKPKDPSAKVWR